MTTECPDCGQQAPTRNDGEVRVIGAHMLPVGGLCSGEGKHAPLADH